MSDLYDVEPADGYVPTLGDVAAGIGLLLGLATLLAYRAWRWTS